MGPRHTRPAQRMIRLAWFRSPKRITLIPPQPVIEVSCGIFAAGVGSLAVSRKFRNSSGNVLNFTFYFNNRRERRWRRLRFLAPRLLACLALRLARQRKQWLFRSPMNTRVGTLTAEHVNALNAVPLEFHKDVDQDGAFPVSRQKPHLW